MMRACHFDVLYTTDETRREVEGRLRARCEGAWVLKRRPRSARPGLRDYRIAFERESDIAKLCRSSASAAE